MKDVMNLRFKMRFQAIFAVAVFVFVPQLSLAEDDSVLTAIKAQNARYMAAYRAGELAEVVALHTKNGTVIAPNNARAIGRDAIGKFLSTEKQLGPGDIELKTVEVVRLNKTAAYETGEYKLTIQPADGPTIKDEGDYVVIWKLEDNVWRMHVDIWNTRLPLLNEIEAQ